MEKKKKDSFDFKIYEADKKYIRYLQSFDPLVENSIGSLYTKERKCLGITLDNGKKYLIPFSSPKGSDYDKEGKIRKSVTPIIRLTSVKDGVVSLKGKLKLSSMIPVSNMDVLKLYCIVAEKDHKYKSVLIDEAKFIARNRKLIKYHANKIYREKVNNLDIGYVKNTVNFLRLEEVAANYIEYNKFVKKKQLSNITKFIPSEISSKKKKIADNGGKIKLKNIVDESGLLSAK
jgi:hypothetical protein